jgi:general secretion pathway protein C
MVEAEQSEKQEIFAGRVPNTSSRFGNFLHASFLLLLAIQMARLAWIVLASAGPVGPAKPAPVAPSLQSVGFDPFFRLQAVQSSSAVTSLPLKLFGTRRDSATGLGSAIIATPDGVQSSYAVGEAILPGVTLASVGSDEVTIERGGAKEKLFLDQSVPAPVIQPATITGASSSIITQLPLKPSAPPEPVSLERSGSHVIQPLEQK